MDSFVSDQLRSLEQALAKLAGHSAKGTNLTWIASTALDCPYSGYPCLGLEANDLFGAVHAAKSIKYFPEEEQAAAFRAWQTGAEKLKALYPAVWPATAVAEVESLFA